MQPRNIVVYVLLSIVTCGIWGIVWYFQLGSDIAAIRGDGKPSPLKDFLLTLLTCGIWSLYVAYQWPTLLQEPLRARGKYVDPNLPVLSLVLGIFGFHIVGMVLMQQLVNDTWSQGSVAADAWTPPGAR